MMHTARQAAATVVEEARCFLHARLPLGISLAALVLTVSLVALSVLSESSLSNSAAVMAGSQFSLLAGIAVILFIPADLNHLRCLQSARILRGGVETCD